MLPNDVFLPVLTQVRPIQQSGKKPGETTLPLEHGAFCVCLEAMSIGFTVFFSPILPFNSAMFELPHPTFLISLLIAFTVHEWSHAVMATRLGDPTPHNAGRLTLNPLAHLDPMGTILFLVAHFGWAKPVPFNPVYFKNRKMGTFLVALAGPVSNLILAIAAYIGLKWLGGGVGSVWGLLQWEQGTTIVNGFFLPLLATSLFVNLGLMAFNLLPIGPLDGSKVVQLFVPFDYEDVYEQYLAYGPYILLALLVADGFLGFNIISVWSGWIMGLVLQGMRLIFG